MNRNLLMLQHALGMWKQGQVELDPLMVTVGAKSAMFWQDIEAAAQYSAQVSSDNCK